VHRVALPRQRVALRAELRGVGVAGRALEQPIEVGGGGRIAGEPLVDERAVA